MNDFNFLVKIFDNNEYVLSKSLIMSITLKSPRVILLFLCFGFQRRKCWFQEKI